MDRRGDEDLAGRGMMDLESGGRSACAQPTKTPDAAARDDAGQIGGCSGDGY
jgi:hypothetical protein